MTSSVALTSKRSQNQSTAISDDAIVSNMKSCRSCRFWSEKRVVLFMGLQYTVLTPVPILCATYPTGRAADRFVSIIGVSVDVRFYVKFLFFFPFFLVFDHIEDLTGSISNLTPKFVKHEWISQLLIQYTILSTVLIYCATRTCGTVCCHESSIHKVRSNGLTENVNVLQDFTAVVVDNLCASPGILTQHNCECDDTNCRFHGHFCHECHEVQSVQNCEDCVVHLWKEFVGS